MNFPPGHPRRILLGVCGGIAAYKAAELTRELQRRNASVQVVMTASAERFITPLTFAALTGRQVLTSLWQPSVPESTTAGTPQPFDMDHIAAGHAFAGQTLDALVIAPATANILAKLAHGLADDLLSTLALATRAPILVAPAMNVHMWHHPATQANLATLRSRGIHILQPGAGYLACGMVGDGRLASPIEIADAVVSLLQSTANSQNLPQEIPNPIHSFPTSDSTSTEASLLGETLLITAGGTREPIDPVRFLGNRSSGKMGHALAAAAFARGARVLLITTTPTTLPDNPMLEVHTVHTTADMLAAVLTHLPRASAVLMAAAVADFRPTQPATQKLKKSAIGPTFTLELTQNEDILAHIVAHRRPGTLVLGFAAETHNLLPEARRKLHAKHLDAIVANDVSLPTQGIDAELNAGFLLTPTSETPLPLSSKLEMAHLILSHLPNLRSTQLLPR